MILVIWLIRYTSSLNWLTYWLDTDVHSHYYWLVENFFFYLVDFLQSILIENYK